MKRTRAVSLLVVSLIMAAPPSARAAGLITAITASTNPVQVNTDVTFTVKGTSGGCADILLDYGDGQTYKMISVSFDKNTNTTSPAHRYALAKTYLVNATPGKSCTGTATLNLVVTAPPSGGGGTGGGGGGFGRGARYDALAHDHASALMSVFSPRIDSVFPFSVIQPGGRVIVQGENFGAQPGQLKIKLQNGQESNLSDLTWDKLHASGIIDPNLAGVIDQPATLRVVTASGKESDAVPAPFTARREVKVLPMTDVGVNCSQGSDYNHCNTNPTHPGDTGPAPRFNGYSFMALHGCGWLSIGDCSDSGTDTYWGTLANGWRLSSARNVGGASRSDPPVIVTDEPGSFKFNIYWDTTDDHSVNYAGLIYVEGPAETSWK